jgi:lipopolysaccharide biosynthesis glycosyltransferase
MSHYAVVVATDAAFALPTAVALRSLLEHTDVQPDVIVLESGLSAAQRAAIAASLPDGSSPRFVSMGTVSINDAVRSHLPEAAYFRLWAVSAAGEAAERVLYIDSDVLVRQSIDALWGVDLAGNAIGAVRSVNYPALGTRGAVDRWRDLGVDPRAPYFNSGVLLFDPGRWNEEDIARQCLEYVSTCLRGRLADQEALNAVLAGRFAELGPEWNQQPSLLDDHHGAHLLYDDGVISRARETPIIVHFQDRPKPWHRDCTHPRAGEWREVAAHTAFHPMELQRTPLREVVRWRVKRAASALIKGR